MTDVPDRGAGLARDEAFWRFSLALYARQRVAEALIALQDRCGLDVNLVLFALWLGATRSEVLDQARLAAAAAAIAPLNEAIVVPLRQRRRQLRADPAPDLRPLRRRLAALEMTAERRVQSRLARLAGPSRSGAGDRGAIVEANLALVLGAASGAPQADVLRDALAALMRRG